MTSLRADRLYRFFHTDDEEVLALQGVTLTVDGGEMVAVTGPSGSGKSTLLACLAGLDEPDGGTVTVAGTRLSRRTETERAQMRARHVGTLFQSHNLLEHLDVTANVRLAQALVPGADRPDVTELVARVGLVDRATALPDQLSGGERARAGLAVALANAPTVLLADEPTGELDGATEERVIDLLRAQAHAGTAVVVVTHSRAVADHADRTIELFDGQVR